MGTFPHIDSLSDSRLAQDISRCLSSRPDTMGGRVVIKKTRIPIHVITARYRAGESLETLREDYPHVAVYKMRAAIRAVRLGM